MAMESNAIEMRSPTDRSMSSSRFGGSSLIWRARDKSSSVVSPMAETTATTPYPWSRVSTILRATVLSLSTVATEDPPNF